jgi:signal transduction histidine kinase
VTAAPFHPVKVEEFVGYLRIFGLLAGLLLALLTDFPSRSSEVVAWATLTTLAVATVAMWGWVHSAQRPNAAMVHVGFVVDTLLITGFVLAWAHLEPNVSWAVVFTLVADASLRYGVRGAVLGYLLAVPLFIAETWTHREITGEVTGVVGHLFVLSTLFGIAGVLGTFSHVVVQQARASHDQALALANALRVRERLIATSSHEYRGSLTAILLGVETVRTKSDRLSPARIQSTLDEVVRQTRHLERLVEDSLSVAQANTDDIGIRPRAADVADTIDLGIAAASRHRRGHLLEISVDRVTCELDHERLAQVVRNLVENAYKYSPEGSRVSVTTTYAADVLALKVADNGSGIPLADRERIFEPFRRRPGETDRADSVGLGLYLVKQIVAAMNGSIDLRTSSSGSDFVVRLPTPMIPVVQSIGRVERAVEAD